MMAPDSALPQGKEMPNNGTAIGDECRVCGNRFTVMHWRLSDLSDGPYCGKHFPPLSRQQS